MKDVIRSLFILTILLFLISCTESDQQKTEFGLVLHGGAGSIYKGRFTAEEEKIYEDKIKEALNAGYEILKNNGTSIEAVTKVITILEDSPLFNAGKGAVLNSEGKVELDASIMSGKDLTVGAVARLSKIKNPILLANAVKDKSKHVFLIGDGAEIFAEEQGFEFVENEYFLTPEKLESFNKIKAEEKAKEQSSIQRNEKFKYGTVGCAALDKDGNLAAGTSTGGIMNKRYGRVGDSPIIGAGTYANNTTCAISATGQGEYFIRGVVAHDISSLMEYKGMNLKEASKKVINEKLKTLGGKGGIIAIDRYGNIADPFNTEGMFRGYILDDGTPVVKFYKED